MEELATAAHAEEMIELFETLTTTLNQTQSNNARYYDKSRKPITFKIGDQVWLHTTNIRTQWPNQKLGPKQIVPFSIKRVINQNAYKLNLLAHLWIWPVFNVDQLEPYIPLLPGQPLPPAPDPDIINGKPEWEVDVIIDARRHRGTYQYRVHWMGLL